MSKKEIYLYLKELKYKHFQFNKIKRIQINIENN